MSFKDRVHTPDYSSPEGALKLIERIKAHWAERGASPIIKPLGMPGDAAEPSGLHRYRVDIRSNMVNGLPVGFEPKAAE